MKKIVVYRSKTGFAEKYAKWIAEALKCDVEELKKVSVNKLQEYDVIIYGAGVMAGMMNDMKKVKAMQAKLLSKKWVVYAVGATPDSDEGNVSNIKNVNMTDTMKGVPFFYFQGGINYDKMGFIPRSMLRMVGNTLEKKENKTEAEVDMAQIFSSSFDKTDKKYIEPLVACVNGL
ncbi:MAG TPA: flavodoxin domain-containing protein [Lachnospiraceae bacterium]|jgi:menaquinone-dependent protoporphyrinogen IX oxidase|nr:flavodoxin domain-containing protein [Lachnospiraceae bacterium]